MARGYQTADATAPASRAAAVTLHDTNTIENTRAVFVGGAGNLKVTMYDGQDVTFTGVGAGTFLPIQVTKIWATGSTATSVLALY
jgi:hypothetical protein